ncbi:metalloregulator ArsR/SmtB family transcription factor [Microbacterium sp. NPDC058062]|uniref:metalloregulator ArsR/SmtB family transcription factor n=1 Tax=Microbacterium sp. NPDC058062 TaxID=3346320 RepID=UPI0036DF242D
MKGAAQRGLTILADPTRARILRLIRDADGGHALVGKLADALGLRQPTVSHHMKALLSEGVVLRERDGRRVWYSIAPDQIDRVNALIGDGDGGVAPAAPDLGRIVDDLALRFRGTFSPETVRASVESSYDLLATGSSSPLLASRTAAFAATRLEALSRAQGDLPARPEVLFVCVQNSGRSQLAAGILRHLAGDRVGVRSAGSAPGPEVRTSVVQALDEIGVSVGGEFPKPLTDDVVRAADVVVTMGCGDSCPVFPGRRYLDWPLEDPVGKPMDTVRSIRDDIESRVRALLDEILAY